MTSGAAYLGLFLGAATLIAQAQTVPLRQAGSSAQPESLEEIVITAQRRVERLDQVPIAASVVSGTELAARCGPPLEDFGGPGPAPKVSKKPTPFYVQNPGVRMQNPKTTNPNRLDQYSRGVLLSH